MSYTYLYNIRSKVQGEVSKMVDDLKDFELWLRIDLIEFRIILVAQDEVNPVGQELLAS